MPDIDINIVSLRKNATDFQIALSDFEDAVKKYEKSISKIEDLDSEYIKQLKKALDCFGKKHPKTIQNDLKNYNEKLNTLLDEFEDVDVTLASGFKC